MRKKAKTAADQRGPREACAQAGLTGVKKEAPLVMDIRAKKKSRCSRVALMRRQIY